METGVNLLFVVTIPTLLSLLYLISKGLLLIVIFGGFWVSVMSLYVLRNSSRKEVLHIIRSDKGFHFNLSDDQLFYIEMKKEENIHEFLRKVVAIEKKTIDEMVYYINFVNFKNKALQKELNGLIKKEQ